MKKGDKLAIIFMMIILLAVCCIIFAVKFAWAKYAFNDWRCMFSECRIIK